jgi:hypothetical protein
MGKDETEKKKNDLDIEIKIVFTAFMRFALEIVCV